MRRAAVMVLCMLALATACAAPRLSFTRAGATMVQASQDEFECSRQVKAMFKDDLVVGPLWWVAAQQSKGAKREAQAMQLCMQGRGYTVSREE